MPSITPKQLIHAYREIVAGASIDQTFRALVIEQMMDTEKQVYYFVRLHPYKTSLQIANETKLDRAHAAMILLRLTRQGILLRELHTSHTRRDQYVYYDGFTADAPSAGEEEEKR